MDFLRFAFIVPEWLMALALGASALSFVVRLRTGARSADNGDTAFRLLAYMFGVQALLYVAIWVSGNRSGLAWLIRLNLLVSALALLAYNVKVVYEHYRDRRSVGGGGFGAGDARFGGGVGEESAEPFNVISGT